MTPIEARRALEKHAWTITTFTEKAIVLVDRPLDVTRIFARKNGRFASIAILGQCEDGDETDRITSPFFREGVSRRRGPTKLYASAFDGEYALREIVALEPKLRACASFADAIALVDARGWSVDHPRCIEDTWEFNWEIFSKRANDLFRLSMLFRASLLTKEPEITAQGSARIEAPGAVIYGAISSISAAETALDDLTA